MRQERRYRIRRLKVHLARIRLGPLHKARNTLVPRRDRFRQAKQAAGLARHVFLMQHAENTDEKALAKIDRRGEQRVRLRRRTHVDQIGGIAKKKAVLR
ncbi:MAG TPA: hypothetical protein PLD10_09150, partial [Rhodopila sp.]|nr:hypothetical protein [Rhodopila sp.]